jgi:hypothetical protein
VEAVLDAYTSESETQPKFYEPQVENVYAPPPESYVDALPAESVYETHSENVYDTPTQILDTYTPKTETYEVQPEHNVYAPPPESYIAALSEDVYTPPTDVQSSETPTYDAQVSSNAYEIPRNPYAENNTSVYSAETPYTESTSNVYEPPPPQPYEAPQIESTSQAYSNNNVIQDFLPDPFSTPYSIPDENPSWNAPRRSSWNSPTSSWRTSSRQSSNDDLEYEPSRRPAARGLNRFSHFSGYSVDDPPTASCAPVSLRALQTPLLFLGAYWMLLQ